MAYSLFDYYKARRLCRPVSASTAFRLAKRDFQRQGEPESPRKSEPSTGDVFRIRDRRGISHTLVLAMPRDDDATPPWDRSEGHGVVSEWTTRDKLPGERVLSEDRGSKRFYDVQETQKTALRDGWGLSPDNLAKLERELGRKPTRRQIAARAVEMDFEFIQSWCNDSWEYVGVCLFVMPRDGEYRDPEQYAQSEPFAETESFALWGVESCASNYIPEVISDLLDDARRQLSN